jgi:hypothetical protein
MNANQAELPDFLLSRAPFVNIPYNRGKYRAFV